jgi:large subunit ribosomal protein L30
MAGQLKITLKRSLSGRPPVHRATVRALGFHRVNETRVLPDNSAVRGMINKISHMLEWEAVKGKAK